jgi:5'-nucleotidase
MSLILVDQDGVLADWGLGYNEGLDAHGDAAKFIPRHRDQRTFSLHDERTPDEIAIIAEVMNNMDYADLRPIRGAKTALRAMVRAGHTVRIVTSPWPTNARCASSKLDWVRDHLGVAWVPRVIIAADKTFVRGDYLIDDKPAISGDLEPTWEHIYYTQPYNRDLLGRRRITNWNEWESVIND